MDDLDEVLNRDTDGKINWLVSNFNELHQSVETINSVGRHYSIDGG